MTYLTGPGTHMMVKRPELPLEMARVHIAPGVTVGRSADPARPIQALTENDFSAAVARDLAGYLLAFADEADAAEKEQTVRKLAAVVRGSLPITEAAAEIIAESVLARYDLTERGT